MKDNKVNDFLLTRVIALIDKKINEQLTTILDHPTIRQLEASWQGLLYLIKNKQKNISVQIKLLSIDKKLLAKSLGQVFDLDQSEIFNKIYHNEFGMPGGEPYSLLLGDYEFSHHHADVDLLDNMAQVAQAAFCPFVSACSAKLFGLTHFSELACHPRLSAIFNQPEYRRWNNLRKKSSSRFVGLCFPHLLVREPYSREHPHGARFSLNVLNSETSYLWANAGYAFASVLIRAFRLHAWPANISGVNSSMEGGAVVPPCDAMFSTDVFGVAPKGIVDLFLSDQQEYCLKQLGFIALTQQNSHVVATFYNNASAYKTSNDSCDEDTLTQLQYLLCICRFAHYLKIIGREKVGSFSGPNECQAYLNNWLVEYVAANNNLSLQKRAKYPLQEAKVQVKASMESPGIFHCTIYLKPCFQLDEITTSIVLTTDLEQK